MPGIEIYFKINGANVEKMKPCYYILLRLSEILIETIIFNMKTPIPTFPQRGKEQKEIARWAISANLPACRDGLPAVWLLAKIAVQAIY
ncbi:MAG: hypothetical protein U0T33_11840 [Bacteroidales bacterium]